MATIRKRIGRNGDVTYTAMVRMAGFPTQTKTMEDKAALKRWATGVEADLIAGRANPTEAGCKRTLADATDRWRAEVLPQMKDGSMYGFTLDWWKSNHGTRK